MVFAGAGRTVGGIRFDQNICPGHQVEDIRHCIPGRIECVHRVLQYLIFAAKRELRIDIELLQERFDIPTAEILIDNRLHFAAYVRDLRQSEIVNLVSARTFRGERSHQRGIACGTVGIEAQCDVLTRRWQILLFDKSNKALDRRGDLRVEYFADGSFESFILDPSRHTDKLILILQ